MLDAGHTRIDCIPRRSASSEAARWHKQSAHDGDVNIWRKTTSGTTNDVKTVSYSESFYFQQLFLPIRRFFHHANVTPDPECVVLSINNSGRSGNWLFKDPVGWFGAIALLNIDERSRSSVFEALEIVAALRPAAIISTPPLFELLVELGALKSLEATAFFVSSGAELNTALKQRLELTIGSPVLNCYALSETSVIAVECTHGQGLHIDPFWTDVRLDGALGKRGEIIIAACANDAMPIKDFRTGDFAQWCDAPCSCGSHTPRFTHLEGKQLPLFHLPDGTFLDPGRLNRSLPPILGTYRFMVHQTAAAEFTIAMPADAFGETVNSADVAKALSGIFPDGCHLQWLPRQDFSKQRKFVRWFE